MITKTALVTGASSGIGHATAIKLRELGYTVYGAARRVERMADLAELGIRPLGMDVTDDASMTSGVAHIVKETGRLDVLVNNAGYGSYGALEDVPIDEARRQFEVNVFGLARLTQLALPHMRAQGGGHVINISSIGGKIYEPLGSWYHATKHAVEGLSDSLRLEVKPFGIHVVIIEPGAIRTEWSDISADSLLKTSGGTAYGDQARTVAALLTMPDGRLVRSSPPSVIADAIGKAVTARRPKTRYVVGAAAKPSVIARRVLSDRGFDAMITATFKAAARSNRGSADAATPTHM